MKKSYIIYGLLVAAFIWLIVYRVQKNKAIDGGGKANAAFKTQPPLNVQAKVVQFEKFENKLELSGSIEANEQIELRTEVSGIIRLINFEEGARVSKGQLLLKMDDRELQAQLSQAGTRQQLASQTEQRASQLLNKEAISTEEYEVAKADLESLKAQTNLVQAQLSKTKILAPFSGKIGLRSVYIGQFIGSDQIIASLVNTDPVKITFALPEKYAQQVKLNSEISFTVSGNSKVFMAKVYALEPSINTNTRTLQIRAKAANGDGALIPGLFAKVILPLAAIENAILIPSEAIIPVQRGKKVFILSNGLAKDVMIETESRTDKHVLVTNGLKPGDTVLTSGIMMIKKDTKIKVNISENAKTGKPSK